MFYNSDETRPGPVKPIRSQGAASRLPADFSAFRAWSKELEAWDDLDQFQFSNLHHLQPRANRRQAGLALETGPRLASVTRQMFPRKALKLNLASSEIITFLVGETLPSIFCRRSRASSHHDPFAD